MHVRSFASERCRRDLNKKNGIVTSKETRFGFELDAFSKGTIPGRKGTVDNIRSTIHNLIKELITGRSACGTTQARNCRTQAAPAPCSSTCSEPPWHSPARQASRPAASNASTRHLRGRPCGQPPQNAIAGARLTQFTLPGTPGKHQRGNTNTIISPRYGFLEKTVKIHITYQR